MATQRIIRISGLYREDVRRYLEGRKRVRMPYHTEPNEHDPINGMLDIEADRVGDRDGPILDLVASEH